MITKQEIDIIRNNLEHTLRQLLTQNRCVAHLKVDSTFEHGELTLTIITDPRSVQFIDL